jgi:hypothetical protein
VVKDGNGERDLEKTEGVKKVDDSIHSQTKREKRSTIKTSKLTPELALEILQQSILECQQAGIEVQVIPQFFSSGSQYLGIVMAKVAYVDGNLRLIDGNQEKTDGK